MRPSVEATIAALQARLEARYPHHVPWWEQHAPIPAPQRSGLSKAQKALLLRLYRQTQQALTAYRRPGNPERCGVRWSTQSACAVHERSHAASQSRTLHRLAARGLVVRLNNVRGNESRQATHVRLTDAGRNLAAQRLT